MQDAVILTSGFAAAFFGTRAAIALAWRIGALDLPAQNKIHAAPVPRLGGLGIAAGVVVGSCLVAITHPSFRREAIWVTAAALAASAVGLVDDLVCLTPRQKLFGISIAAAIPLAGGLGPNGAVGMMAALVLVVFMANAVNLLDGMDGLAGGVAVIAAMAFSAAFSPGAEVLHLLSLALAGAILGFLWFNQPPARTFMGDSGSLLLGCMLGWMAVLLGSSSVKTLPAAVIIPAVPIADTLFVMCRRLLMRKPVMLGGLDHTYNLLARRTGDRAALLVFCAVSLVLGTLGVLMSGL